MAAWARLRRVAALSFFVLSFFVSTITVVALPSAAGAAGSSAAVDDTVTAVVNATDGHVNVLANDTRVRSGPFNAFAIVYPAAGATAAGGSYACTSSTCTYTAPAGYLGPDSFTYRLTYPAPNGGNTGPFSLATVTLSVVADEPPVAVDDAVTARGTGTFELTENDTDPNRQHVGETLRTGSATITTAAGGTATCPSSYSPGACDYVAPPNFDGTDQFDYTVVDLNGATDLGTVTVVVPPNNAPVAIDDAHAIRVRYGATSLPVYLDVGSNDSDPDGDWLVARAEPATTAAGGTISCENTFCGYTPPTGFFGTDAFTYVATDTYGATSAPATVTVTVGDDLPPVAIDDTTTTKGTRSVAVAVLANDTDDRPGGPYLVSSWAAGGSDLTSANGGAVACFDSTCTYTPPAAFVGTDTFTYVVSDDVTRASGTVTIVVGANAAPVAQDDALQYRVDDGNANDGDYRITVWAVANDSDADGDVLVAEGYGVTAPSGLEWYCFDQRCEVVAPEGFVGVETLTYTATDGFGGTDTATATVDIDTLHTGTPDAQPDSATTSAGAPVTIDVLANDTFYDPVDATLTVRAGTFTSVAGGTVVCSTANCTYTPPAGFAGTDTFIYKALTRYLNGAHETVTVVVNAGVSGTTANGGTFATGNVPTAADPLTTSVLTPVGGVVQISERATQSATSVGHALFGQEAALVAPGQTTAAPLQVTFQLDTSLLSGTAASAVRVWRNGTLVANCGGGSAATAASPDPCVKQRTALTGGDARIVVLSSSSGVWSFGKLVATAPGAPTGVTASAGIRSIVATWSPPSSDGGAPIASYQVTATPISIPAGVTATARTTTVTGSPTTATVTGLVNGVTYAVTVKARNEVITAYGPASDPSPAVTTPAAPSTPVITTASGGVRSITATWAAPVDGGSPVTTYRLSATPVGGGTTRAVTVTAPSTTGTVTGLADATGYTLTITATNAAGTSAVSTPTGPTPTASGIPAAPTAVTVAPGVRSLAMSWTAPTDDGGAPISGYRVTATPVPATVPAGITAVARTVSLTGAPPATTATVTGLLNGVTYTVTVTARNSAVSTYSASSAPVGGAVFGLPGAPGTPTLLAGPTGAMVTWATPPSDLPITGFTIRATALRPGTTPHTVTRSLAGLFPVPTNTGFLNGLIADLDYTVTVTATSGVGTGPASAAAVVRPLVGLSITDRSLTEGNTSTKAFTFTVRLSAAQTSTVTVDVATADGTAGLGDYVPLATTLMFAPGEISKTVTVRVAGDVTAEADETFAVTLSNPSAGGLTKPTGFGTIVNDDV